MRNALSSRRMIEFALQALLFAIIVMICASFRTRAYGSQSADWQVLMRLGLMAMAFAVCVLCYRHWLGALTRLDNLPLAILSIMFVLSAGYAPAKAYSLGCAFSVLAFILLQFTCIRVLGFRRTLFVMIAATTFLSLLSIAVYFAIPSIGHAKIWVDGRQVASRRMAGLSSANGTGGVAELAVLFLIFYAYYFRARGFWLNMALLLNLVVLVMSYSRTAMATLVLALVFGFFMRATPPRLAVFFFGLAALVVAACLINYTWLFTELARSGNPEEIMTGTGRTAIWKKSLELIALRPWAGYGYGSTSFILPQFTELGDVAPHCHNVYLQLAFSIGWAGPVLYLTFLLTKFVQSLILRDRFRLAVLFILFVGGLTEAQAFAGVANIGTMLLAMIAAIDRAQPRLSLRPREDVRAPAPAAPALVAAA